MASDKKEIILESTVALLKDCKDIKDVTTRRIADKASVNPAKINYYFDSKDNLLVQGFKRMMSDFLSVNRIQYNTGNPAAVLEKILNDLMCEIISYKKYLRVTVPRMLMDDEIHLSKIIAPLIKEYYGVRKTEAECKFLAYRSISFLLLAIHRSVAVTEYCGLNITDEKEYKRYIVDEVKMVLGL